MKISQLIEKLQEQKADNGDMEVVLFSYLDPAGQRDEWLEKITVIEPMLDDHDKQVKLAIY